MNIFVTKVLKQIDTKVLIINKRKIYEQHFSYKYFDQQFLKIYKLSEYFYNLF